MLGFWPTSPTPKLLRQPKLLPQKVGMQMSIIYLVRCLIQNKLTQTKITSISAENQIDTKYQDFQKKLATIKQI